MAYRSVLSGMPELTAGLGGETSPAPPPGPISGYRSVLSDMPELFERPEPPDEQSALEAFGAAAAQGATRSVTDLPKSAVILGGALGLVDDPQQNPVYEAMEAVDRYVAEALPVSPAREGDFFTKLGGGIGSTAGFLAGGGGAGLVARTGMKGAARLAAAAGMGAGMESTGQFEQALQSGASFEDAYKAAGIGAAIGTSEALPISRMLDRLDKASGGKWRRLFIEAAKGGTEELAQETFQSVFGNLTASTFVGYDPDRQVFEGTGEAGAVGFTVGGLFNFIMSAVGGRRAKSQPAAREETAPAPTLDQAEVDRRRQAAVEELVQAAEPETERGRAATGEGPAVSTVLPTAPIESTPASPIEAAGESIAPEAVEIPAESIAPVAPPVAGVAESTVPVPTVEATPAKPATIERAPDLDDARAVRPPAEPTPAQAEAGNYQQTHLRWQGLEIAIETEKGGTRRDKVNDPPQWEVSDFPADYGRIKRTEGADGDQVDVYLGDKPESESVFVIDQVDPKTGKFDEHKVMAGFASQDAALATYNAAFDDGSGPSRVGAVTRVDVAGFKAWLADGDTAKPFGELPGAAKPTEAEAQLSREEARRLYDEGQEIMAKLPSNIGKAKMEGKIGPKRQQKIDRLDEIERVLPPGSELSRQVATESLAEATAKYDETRAAFAEEQRLKMAEAGFRIGDQVYFAVPAMIPGLPGQRFDGVVRQGKRGDIYVAVKGHGKLDLFRNPWQAKADEEEPTAALAPPGGQAPQPEAAEVGPEGGAAEVTSEANEAARAALQVANKVAERLSEHRAVSRAMLNKMGNDAFGGTQAEGAYEIKQLDDALELGVNMAVANRGLAAPGPIVGIEQAKASLRELEKTLGHMPTQTRRTREQERLQQFSTPIPYAYVANWVANLKPDDVVLEPSAGTGSLLAPALAAWHQNRIAGVVANEISDRRADLLVATWPHLPVHRENAEHLNAIFAKRLTPSVIVMNPPFSRSPRMGDKKLVETGAKHVEQALLLLKPGGRLVAIVGRGMSPEMKQWDGFRERIGPGLSVRANVGVSGKLYRKYGTVFDNRLLVIDKVPAEGTGSPVTGDFDNLESLIDALEPIHRTRTDPGKQPAAEPAGEAAAGPDRVPGTGRRPVSAATSELGPERQPRRRRGAAAEGRDGRRGGSAVRPAAEEGVGVAGVPGRPGTESETDAGGVAGLEPERGGSRGAGVAPRPSERDAGVVSAAASKGGRVRIAAQETGRQGELTEEVYEAYQPARIRVPGAQPHPSDLVESAAMASVIPPEVTYRPNLPAKLIKSGVLSEAQLESVIYAGQAHEKMLPDDQRRGFFIGDGTGVGKGREIAGIIMDNWRQGRRRAVWMSQNKKLLDDSREYWQALGGNPNRVVDLGKIKSGQPIKIREGILFVTYSTLKMGAQTARQRKEGPLVLSGRARQIVDWLGDDFDGVLAFDESHRMANALARAGDRGQEAASAIGLVGVEMQKALPQARVVYSSATGATDVRNLAYATRLGLWGRGTPFADVRQFVNEIQGGGVAAMELVARDMKALGSYMARNLSFAGVEQESLLHTLTDEQRVMYDELARGWQIVLQNINAALKASGASENPWAKSRAQSAFWSAHQRFFNSVLTAMQMPTVLRQMEQDLNDGFAVLAQLVNTGEAAQERAAAQMADEDDLTALDMSPIRILAQMIETSFPVQQYEDYIDDNGNERTRPVTDSAGEPVLNPEAVGTRDALLDRLGALRAPDPALVQLIEHFGPDKVAEATGRSRRFVRQPDGSLKEERRGPAKMKADIKAFIDGKKNILVFSEAGGTGASYHADRSFKNQRRRAHYLIQPGWRADMAIQGFGRSHRSNQVVAPLYRVVQTDLKGHKRFVSSIARRLDQLGALTKGERKTGGQGMFSEADNLEGGHATEALHQLFRDADRHRVEGFTVAELEEKLGIKVRNEQGELLTNKLPSIPRFLNRLLSLEIKDQNRLFDHFTGRLERIIAAARQRGDLDVGVETVRADRISKRSGKIVHTDPATGAETEFATFDLEHKVDLLSFEDAKDQAVHGFHRNVRSGKIWAARSRYDATTRAGEVIATTRLRAPASHQTVPTAELEDSDKWQPVSKADARKPWAAAIAEAPKTRKSELHLITGAVLPIWDRLRGEPRIRRLRTDDGERYLGRVIHPGEVSAVMRNLGVTADAPRLTPSEAMARVVDDNYRLRLANEWVVRRRRVSDEYRIEVEGPDAGDIDALKREGVFTERIAYQTRFFIPVGDEKAYAAFLEHRPITEAIPPSSAEAAPDVVDDPGREHYSITQTLTPRAQEDIEGIKADILKVAQRMSPGVTIEFSDRLFGEGEALLASGATTAERQRVAGYAEPARGLIAVALKDPKFDPRDTAFHESWHLVEDLLTDQERAILHERYPGEGKVTPQEATAIDYAAWATGKGGKMLPKVRRIFAKIRRFLQRVGNALRKRGFQSVDDIFEAARAGEVGRRGRTTEDTADYSRNYSEPSFSVTTMGPQAPARARKGRTAADDAIDKVMDQGDQRTLTERMSDLVTGIKDRGLAEFKQGFLDQFAAIETMEGRGVDASQSAYKAALRTQNLAGVMGVALHHGPIRLNAEAGVFEVVNKYKDGKAARGFLAIFEDIAKAGGLRLWKGYAIARRSERLIKEGREKVLNQREIDTLLRLGKEHPEFEKAFQEWQQFNAAMLDMAEGTGLIDPEQRKVWEKNDYVPFYRVLGDEGVGGPGTKRGLSGQSSGIRALRGGEQKIGDVIENMMLNITHLVDASFKNIAMQRTVDLAKSAGVLSTVAPGWRPVRVAAEQAVAALERNGVEVGALSKEEKRQWLRMFEMVPPREPDVVSVRNEGKATYYRVHDPLLLRSLVSLDPRNRNAMLRLMRGAKRLLTSMVTADPAFMLANLIRDTAHSWVVTGHQWTPIFDTAKGFARALREDTALVDIMAAGAGSLGYYRTAPADVRRMLDAKMARMDRSKLIDSPRKAWELWQRLGQASENANRLAIHAAVLKAGGTKAEAVHQAQDLLNFSMHGDWATMRWLTATVPFMNARIQGLYRLGRGARDNPQRFILRGLLLAVASVALWALNEDDDRYKELEDWDKDAYYHFFVGDDHYRIPKPFEVGAIFSTIPERMMEQISGKAKEGDAFDAFKRMTLDTFALNPIPQLFRPAFEQMQNRVFFTGRPIEGMAQEGVKPEARYRPTTSPSLIALAETLTEVDEATGDLVPDVARSPLRLEHLVRGYFGTLGMYVLDAADVASREATGRPVLPERRWDQIPVIKRFVRDDPAYSTKWRTKFYDLSREVTSLYKTIRRYRIEGEIEKADRLLERHRPELVVRKQLSAIQKVVRGINKRMRHIYSDRTMSPATKRQKIDDLLRHKNATFKRTESILERIQKLKIQRTSPSAGPPPGLSSAIRAGDLDRLSGILREHSAEVGRLSREDILQAIDDAEAEGLARLMHNMPAKLHPGSLETLQKLAGAS